MEIVENMNLCQNDLVIRAALVIIIQICFGLTNKIDHLVIWKVFGLCNMII